MTLQSLQGGRPVLANQVTSSRDEITKEYGKLICFCGIDGSGKTTQLNLVRSSLRTRGYTAKSTKLLTKRGEFFRNLEPLIGSISDQYYCDLFAFQRYQAANNRLPRELANNQVVLSDRYLFDDLAYAEAYECTTTTMLPLLDFVPKPDLVLLFDAPADVAMQRIRKRGEIWHRQERPHILQRARQAFLRIAKEFGFLVVKSDSSVENTHREVMGHLANVLSEGRGNLT